MGRKMIRRATCLAALLIAGAARADLGELVDRLPSHANAIVAVDVAPLLAARQGGGDVPHSPVPLPKVAGLQGLVLAAHVKTGTMEPAWEVAVMRVAQKPSMAAVASASGGFVDAVSGREAAWCANDTYCVLLDDRTLGSVFPADRQFAARWASPSAAGGTTGASDREYLRAAASLVKPGTPLVIAIDLKDAVSEAGVRQALQAGGAPWASGISGGEATAARLLAGVRGVTVRVTNIGPDGAEGALAVEFQGDATPLAPAAKSLVVGVLSDNGLSVPDLAQWQFAAEGRALTGTGRLSPGGIERLVGFLDSPTVASPEGGKSDGGAEQAGAKGGAAAAPSRAYYKSVSSVLDSFTAGSSLADSAGWLNRNARRIDQLPSDGVDPELLLFGAEVSARLREAAGILAAGQQRVRARSLSAQAPAAYTAGQRDSARAAQARADVVNAKRQAEQAASEERANAIQEASKPLQAAAEARGKVRAAMAQKYGGGF